ncbi:hypothetical protein [Deinococcus frigens]|uniref:hypothetical protein n=1 Tax=Deinococcus frigens TaxID=249403 RepID=UPI0012EC0777|nr:hypothetical protein [Deinococcus frigens]
MSGRQVLGFFFVALIRPDQAKSMESASNESKNSSTLAAITFVSEMIVDPEGTGGQCLASSMGKSCIWESKRYFDSAEMSLLNDGKYTVILGNPVFDLIELGIDSGPGSKKHLIATGPLQGNFAQAPMINTGHQINIISPNH